MKMTVKQTLEQFILAWNSNAYLNMCTSEDMKNAIECMEEVEQYRALGTVEGFQSALDSSMEYYNQMKKYKYKLQDYEALGTPTQILERIGGLDVELGKYACIGTVEELKEAREKQVAKKPKSEQYFYGVLDRCPVCDVLLGHSKNYCHNCGQALKWGEEDD